MVMLDKRRFDAAFNYLATATRMPTADMTPTTKRVYFDALSELTDEAVEGAAAQLAKSAQWFPKVAEWREAARSYKRDSNVKAFPVPRAEQWRHECDFCEDTGWCYEGGKTFHDVVLSAYEGRPRMHACVCRSTNRTYQRHNRNFGADGAA
jgi:hypothetical protein